MRDPLEHTSPSPAEKRSDLLLWTGMLLSPLAMGVNTIVGFTVAHWTCDTNQKKFSYLVSVTDLVLCAVAFFISYSLMRQYQQVDEEVPIDGRRVFMAKMSLLLSIIAAL